ncbi:PDDEXK-like family protein [Hymenobacter psychrophilus]|uniref:PD-(D/E)XK nuclease superfamily protein n=1 Tax=Hymenobacter psychrophilus TaxID=651662 RepID=A0A1H3IRI4_9BACT|nr:PD-(D/E)XK nuclease family protein [Hymenobacter psychrophilus]SDY30396.1 PD-(D/E)XK nuclease superfamily protein [Hymenobacter psychrophilus]
MEIQVVRKLLNQVTAINRTQEKLNLLGGAEFNVFKILGLQTNEVRTHSAFIGELLNPRGCHGLKSRFLELFLETLRIENFHAELASVQVEKYAGPIDDNYLEGGRIDIHLKGQHGQFIFIENKIYAGDQRNQLARYYNYEPRAHLIYLTLDGNLPSDWSLGQLAPEQYNVCSYRVEISQWLEKCYKEAAAYPTVRETIGQYLNLISSLVGNVPDNFMKEEVKRLLLHDRANIESAAYLAEMLQEVKAETVALLNSELYEKWDRAFRGDLCPLEKYTITFSKQDNYFGFTASKGEMREICRDKALAPFVALVKEVHPKFKNNGWWLGWKNFIKATAFESLPLETLFIMANSEEERARLIEEIISEAKPHYTAFKKLVSAYKRREKS